MESHLLDINFKNTHNLSAYFLLKHWRRKAPECPNQKFSLCFRLPCSFNTYVILGAYVIQSEAGDWDAEAHEGIEYLYNVPFAPKNLQTPEMLIRIAELHQKLK